MFGWWQLRFGKLVTSLSKSWFVYSRTSNIHSSCDSHLARSLDVWRSDFGKFGLFEGSRITQKQEITNKKQSTWSQGLVRSTSEPRWLKFAKGRLRCLHAAVVFGQAKLLFSIYYRPLSVCGHSLQHTIEPSCKFCHELSSVTPCSSCVRQPVMSRRNKRYQAGGDLLRLTSFSDCNVAGCWAWEWRMSMTLTTRPIWSNWQSKCFSRLLKPFHRVTNTWIPVAQFWGKK